MENAFGILAARWRVFRSPIEAHPDHVQTITTAAIVLHNYLMSNDESTYVEPGFADHSDENGKIQPGKWRVERESNLKTIPSMRGTNYKKSAIKMRETLADYLSSDAGSVPWQWSSVTYRPDLGSDEEES